MSIKAVAANRHMIPYCEDETYWAVCDNTRLKAARWYQRLLAMFSFRYRRKFLDIKGFECTINK